MKPASFHYHAPGCLDEALALLDKYGADAKVIAGGQSLVPVMNMRLAQPAQLIDLNRLAPQLDYVRLEADELVIGALARHQTLADHPAIRQACPLLAEAAENIGHMAIRSRGSIGGSLAHGDPAAELPTVCVALDATMMIHGPAGPRSVAARDFFITYMTVDLAPDELVVGVRIPRLDAPGTGSAFLELVRRHGDFALVASAAVVQLDQNGCVQSARIALAGVGPTPERMTAAEELLIGTQPDQDRLKAAALLAAETCAPEGDVHGSADYRRRMSGVYTQRALGLAVERARGH